MVIVIGPSDMSELKDGLYSTYKFLPYCVEKMKEATTIKLKGLGDNDCIKIARNEIDRLSITNLKNIADKNLKTLAKTTFGIPFLIKWVIGQVKLGYVFEKVLDDLSQLKPGSARVYDYIFQKSFKRMSDIGLKILVSISLSKNPITYKFIVGVTNSAMPNLIKEQLDSLINQNLVDIERIGLNVLYKVHPLTRNYVHLYVSNKPMWPSFLKKFYAYVKEQTIISGRDDAPSYTFVEQNFYTVLSTIDWFMKRNLWQEAISIQQGISRFLWVRGFWKLRIEYGEKILEYAKLLTNKKPLANILMDDLGWTPYSLYNDYKTASARIKKAKTIFNNMNDYYGLVKCIRHLAAIARDNKDFEEAKSYYDKVLNLIEKIENPIEKKEMEAGFHLSLAKLYSRENNYVDALTHIEESIKGFKKINDELRLLKVLNNKAEVLLFINRVDDALDIYQITLESAKKLGRLDQVPIALEGLLKCYVQKHDRKLAKKYFKEAITAYEALGSSTERSRLIVTYKELI